MQNLIFKLMSKVVYVLVVLNLSNVAIAFDFGKTLGSFANEMDKSIQQTLQPVPKKEVVKQTEPKRQETVVKKKKQNLYSLTVKSDQKGSIIRITNIAPKYHDGIKLSPGKYEIQVSKKGFQTYRRKVIISNSNVVVDATLKKILVAKNKSKKTQEQKKNQAVTKNKSASPKNTQLVSEKESTPKNTQTISKNEIIAKNKNTGSQKIKKATILKADKYEKYQMKILSFEEDILKKKSRIEDYQGLRYIARYKEELEEAEMEEKNDEIKSLKGYIKKYEGRIETEKNKIKKLELSKKKYQSKIDLHNEAISDYSILSYKVTDKLRKVYKNKISSFDSKIDWAKNIGIRDQKSIIKNVQGRMDNGGVINANTLGTVSRAKNTLIKYEFQIKIYNKIQNNYQATIDREKNKLLDLAAKKQAEEDAMRDEAEKLAAIKEKNEQLKVNEYVQTNEAKIDILIKESVESYISSNNRMETSKYTRKSFREIVKKESEDPIYQNLLYKVYSKKYFTALLPIKAEERRKQEIADQKAADAKALADKITADKKAKAEKIATEKKAEEAKVANAKKEAEIRKRMASFKNARGYKDIKFGMTAEDIKRLEVCKKVDGMPMTCYDKFVSLRYNDKSELHQLSVTIGDYSAGTRKKYESALANKYSLQYAANTEQLEKFNKQQLSAIFNIYDKGNVLFKIYWYQKFSYKKEIGMSIVYSDDEASKEVLKLIPKKLSSDDI